MNRTNIIRSICTICTKGCGIIIHMEKGISSKFEGEAVRPKLPEGFKCKHINR